MSLYFDPGIYESEIFEQSQYFHIRTAEDLQKHILYAFSTMNNVSSASFQNVSLESASVQLIKWDIYFNEDPEQITTKYKVNITEGIK